MMDMLRHRVDSALFLIIRNHAAYPDQPEKDNWGWCALLSKDGGIPKATYNGFLMFTMLPGTRVECGRPSRTTIGAIASADHESVGVLAYNISWDFAHHTDRAKPENVIVRINGVPFDDAGGLRVCRYLIDETHSNAYHYVRAGNLWIWKNARFKG